MKEITIKLYDYSELSKEAQHKALEEWANSVDDPYLPAHLGNLVKEELNERGIKYDTDTINCLYSLSYCQGDGLMFEGDIEWRGRTIRVKHHGHYYHNKSRIMDIIEGDELSDVEMGQFEAVYEAVCEKIERIGYNEIEYQMSEEAFIEACEINEYTFESNGVMRN